MNRMAAFRYWFSVHMHFTVFSYQMQKYGTKSKNVLNKLSKMSDGELSRFEWFGSHYPQTESLVLASIGCEFDGLDVRFASKDEIKSAANKMIGRRDRMSYQLQQDAEKYADRDLSDLLVGVMADKVSPEYILVRDPDMIELNRIRTDASKIYLKPIAEKLIKYRTFFNPVRTS